MKDIKEIVRKNLISIICGLVAILAIVAIFWPITGMYDALHKKLDQRIAVGSATDAVIATVRHLPLVSPDQTDPGTLNVFPTDDVINAGKAAINTIATEADKMVEAAVKINQHSPLYPNALPKPDDITRYNFAQKYIDETTNNARWQHMLNSTQRPTVAEIATATQEKHDQIYSRLGVTDSTGPDSQAAQQAKEEFAQASAEISSDLQAQRAQGFSIYLEPGALPFDATINVAAGHQPPGADQIWDAQFQMWIVDDVVNAVASINQNFADPDSPGSAPVHDVLHNPVKQLEKLDHIAPVYSPNAGDLAAGNGSATPKVWSVSPTGRVSNAFYDVVRFKLTLLVDAAKVPQVLRGLQTGQFITVWNAQIDDVIDPAIMAQSGFRLGDKPVVRLEIDAEDLMMRSWTADMMPDDRKAALGLGGAPGGGPVAPPVAPEDSGN